MRTPAILLLLAPPLTAAQDVEADRAPEWVALFDGHTLDGWTRRGGAATFRVEDGELVGQTADGSSTYLCTDRGYSDFELRFEVQVDDALNSGVQIRSSAGGPESVLGPQVEVEASGADGGAAGYLYGVGPGAGRGWMTPDEERVPHRHFVDGGWNAYRVLAVGANVKVWINDEPISDLTSEDVYAAHPRGFLGLQVHGVRAGAGPYEVRFRDVKIREIRGREAGWAALFDGEDLSGWSTTGNWLVEEGGVLAIRPRPGEKGWQRYGAYLWSERPYGDFILDLEYAYPAGGNSGVFFRVGDRANPVATGIEAQILDSSKHAGEMTHHDHGGIISTVGASRNMSRPPGEWNRMIVTARGAHLTVDLNGANIIDVKLDQSAVKDRPLRGYIGLQDHGEPNELRFRRIWLKEL